MSLHSTILKQMRQHPTSLAKLQSITQVSLPTLRKAVQDLSDTQWIRVVGQAEANGGRPAKLFGMNDTIHVVIGIHIQLPGLRLIVTDLAGNILEEKEMFRDMYPEPNQVIQAIIDYVIDVRTRLSERNVLGLGIATPGFTDPETGDILTIGRVKGWENLPICRRLRAELNLSVKIANDVDCMAFAEFQYSGKSFENNLAYLGFDEGIKVSLFLNGELYKGSFGNAGLVISRFLHLEDQPYSQDMIHRLLTISGVNQIFESLLAPLDEKTLEIYTPFLEVESNQRFGMILQHADDEKFPVCAEIGKMLIPVLSTAITNAFYFTQPDTIVIGGALGNLPLSVFLRLRETVLAQLPMLFANRAIIELASLSSFNSAAIGATDHFMEDYLLADELFE